MSTDSVNDLAEGQKQVSAQNVVARRVRKPETPGTNDRPKKRRDKGATHATRGGLLSRDIVGALVRSGESLRTLRRYEKKFRAAFRPRGTLGELFFDRWWSCHLRLLLLARLEAKFLTSNHSHRLPPILAELREGDLPTLISPSDPAEYEAGRDLDTEFSLDLFRELALVARYDAHFARDANRMLGLLLVMRKGGKAALEGLVVDELEFTDFQKVAK